MVQAMGSLGGLSLHFSLMTGSEVSTILPAFVAPVASLEVLAQPVDKINARQKAGTLFRMFLYMESTPGDTQPDDCNQDQTEHDS